MAHRVCPWWIGYLLASPLRRLWQDPEEIIAPYVAEGATVLEPGPGMGFFTLALARRVGPAGRVVAVDVQSEMLDALRRRARRARLESRIDARLASGATLAIDDLAGQVDFALAFAVVHEAPDPATFLAEVARALAPAGRLLLAEPSGHVSGADWDRTLALCTAAGLRVADRPRIRSSHTAVLVREPVAAAG